MLSLWCRQLKEIRPSFICYSVTSARDGQRHFREAGGKGFFLSHLRLFLVIVHEISISCRWSTGSGSKQLQY